MRFEIKEFYEDHHFSLSSAIIHYSCIGGTVIEAPNSLMRSEGGGGRGKG